jgi:hypothetical protein
MGRADERVQCETREDRHRKRASTKPLNTKKMMTAARPISKKAANTRSRIFPELPGAQKDGAAIMPMRSRVPAAAQQ